MKKSVAILYGFAEGPLIGKKLICNLKKRGFEIIDDPVDADYIIAHSAGKYFVPSVSNAKKILLDAPSIGDGQTWKNIQYRKAKIDFNHAKETKMLLHWFYKSFLNLLYMIIRIRDEIKMASEYIRLYHDLPVIYSSKVIVITHKHDPWSATISSAVRKKHNRYTYIVSNGVHDDLWLNPDFYINLLTPRTGMKEIIKE